VYAVRTAQLETKLGHLDRAAQCRTRAAEVKEAVKKNLWINLPQVGPRAVARCREEEGVRGEGYSVGLEAA